MADRVYEATIYHYPHAAVDMDERINRAVAAAKQKGATVVEREYSAAENAWLIRGWKSSAQAVAQDDRWMAGRPMAEREDPRVIVAEPFANPWEPRNG